MFQCKPVPGMTSAALASGQQLSKGKPAPIRPPQTLGNSVVTKKLCLALTLCCILATINNKCYFVGLSIVLYYFSN